MSGDEMITCPKTKTLVEKEQCVALRNLSKVQAEFFSVRVCTTVKGCPKEDYCSVFECGWACVGNLLHSTLKD
jgi:hypothetical protein